MPDHISIMVTIVDRGNGKKAAKLFDSLNVGDSVIMMGKGTANSEILDYLGLGETQKDIVMTPLCADKISEAIEMLREKIQLEKHGNGIAMTIPISSIIGHNALKYITGGRHNDDGRNNDMDNKTDNMDYEYNLIITIMDIEHIDLIMNAAKDAGATGGTILHGRGAGAKHTESFMGITIQPEKGVLLIVVRTENKQKIMCAIKDQGKSDIIFSLPVDDLAGLKILKNKYN